MPVSGPCDHTPPRNLRSLVDTIRADMRAFTNVAAIACADDTPVPLYLTPKALAALEATEEDE